MGTLQNINLKGYDTRYIQSLLKLEITPFIFLVAGLFLSIYAFKKSKVINISTKYKEYRIAVNELDKENRVKELIEFLDERCKTIRNV